jgi:hypothetical protein
MLSPPILGAIPDVEQKMNSSRTGRVDPAEAAVEFDRLYRRIWSSAAQLDDPDLSQHERQVLDHIPSEGTTLTRLARHLGLPKGT